MPGGTTRRLEGIDGGIPSLHLKDRGASCETEQPGSVESREDKRLVSDHGPRDERGSGRGCGGPGTGSFAPWLLCAGSRTHLRPGGAFSQRIRVPSSSLICAQETPLASATHAETSPQTDGQS